MATARVERRLAAILAADVVGYSPAHGARRGRARSPGSRRYRKELIEPAARRAPGPHRQAHGRRRARRVRERRRRGALRGADPAGHGGARGGGARSGAHPLPDRHQPRRRGRSRRTATSTATGSTSPPGSSSSASRAGSASPARPTTTSRASSTAASSTSASGSSRTSSGRCGCTGSVLGGASRVAGAAALPDQPVDRRAAVRQHERRPGAGLLQRRDHRGHHHRALASSRASS